MSHVTNHLQNMIHNKTNGELAIAVDALADEMLASSTTDHDFEALAYEYDLHVSELERRGSW